MAHDPNQMTPSGLTYSQIDAREAQYVQGANEALAELRGLGCRWWRYSVSHCTFKLVIGDSLAGTSNMVINLAACQQIAGPVRWPDQQLKIIWHSDREADKAGKFVLEDESVGFRALGGVFSWRRDHDALSQGYLYFERGSGPEAPFTREQAEESVVGTLRRFYDRTVGFEDLVSDIRRLLNHVPAESDRE